VAVQSLTDSAATNMIRVRQLQREALPMMGGSVGGAFQKFAEPWMAEQKRHKDVP
jgi:hypothetical protein